MVAEPLWMQIWAIATFVTSLVGLSTALTIWWKGGRD